MTILIVDDNALNRKLLRVTLEADGYSTIEAEDGVVALERLEHNKVAAIISDILMPNMDGYRFAYEVRRHERYRKIPFIVYTATYTSAADEKLSYELGVNKYLRKPVGLKEVLAALRDALESPEETVEVKMAEPLSPPDWDIMKEYSERLVAKLEEKNLELEEAKENLTRHKNQLLLEKLYFDQLFENSIPGIVLTDADDVIERVNTSFMSLFGFSRDEIFHKNLLSLIVPRNLAKESLDTSRRLRAGETVAQESVRLRRDGSVVDVQIFAVPISIHDRIVGAYRMFIDITGRKRAEEAVHTSQKQFEEFMDNLPAFAWLKDRSGRYVYANKALRDRFPARRNEWSGRTDDELFPEGRAMHFTENDRTVMEAKESLQTVEELVTGTEVRHELVTKFPILNNRGEPVLIGGTAVDVTERRNAEDQLKTAHEQLKNIFDNLDDVFFSVDMQSRTLLQISPACEKIYGVPPAAFYDNLNLWREMIHPEDARRIEEERRALVRGTPIRQEYRIVRPDREIRWLESKTMPTLGARGELVRVDGVVADITERKLMEAARRRAEEKYRSIFENAIEGIFRYRPDGMITEANPAFAQMLGYSSPRELLTTVSNLLEQVVAHPPHRAELRRLMEEEEGVVRGFEAQLVRKEGDLIWVSTSIQRVGMPGEPEYYYEGIAEDITEKKRYQTHHMHAQRLESIGTLAGGVAHDLNNVLAPILMAVDILKQHITDEKGQRVLQMLEQSGRRGATIVKQVLAFARGAEGESIVISPRHLIREIETIIRQTFPRSIEIITSVAGDVMSVAVDPTQIHQVILNICINARDAMEGGGKLEIGARNTTLDEAYARVHSDARTGEYVLLTISDTGTGIPPGILHKIFDPFFTTKGVGKGTGLGLSTARGIIKKHGGFIEAYSEPGRGTNFNIYLPAVATEEHTLPQSVGKDLPQGAGELILIVDDEHAVSEIARSTLEANGYRALVAFDGAEALSVFIQNRNEIKAVFMDMMMPYLDGPSTIRALRKLSPTLKIIGMSGLENKGNLFQMHSLDVHEFLLKPYTADQLLRTLDKVLREKNEQGNISPSR